MYLLILAGATALIAAELAALQGADIGGALRDALFQVVSAAARHQAVFFLALTGVLVASGTVLLSLLEPSQEVVTTLTAVVAAQSNIGPGLAGVGATQNFSALGDASLMLLSLLMVMCRLELFAVLVLFLPALWRRFR